MRPGDVYRGFQERALSMGDRRAISELVSPRFVTAGVEVGPEYVAHAIDSLRTAFPDTRFHLHDVAAEGDLAFGRWTWTGTNGGAYHGRPATGRAIELSGMSAARVIDGRIIELWSEFDRLSLMEQLGRIEGSRWADSRMTSTLDLSRASSGGVHE
jgi:predicted ester cyclase